MIFRYMTILGQSMAKLWQKYGRTKNYSNCMILLIIFNKVRGNLFDRFCPQLL